MGFFFDWTMRLVGPLLLLFASVLISGVIGMYFLYILPATATFGSIAVSVECYVLRVTCTDDIICCFVCTTIDILHEKSTVERHKYIAHFSAAVKLEVDRSS